MGKGSKPQTIGHRYFFGQHLILSSNPLMVLAMKFQDKAAWLGRVRGGGKVVVNSENLFGGKKREGGVSGVIDVLDGAATQDPNDYLLQHIGGPLPAFRNITSLVFRHFYHGNNYYPKAPAIKVTDNHIGRSWYSSKAHFPRGVEVSKSEIYIGIDVSASMLINDRYTNTVEAVAAFLRELKGSVNSVKVHLVGDTSMERANCSDADYEDIAGWLEALPKPDTQFHLVATAAGISSFVTTATASTPPWTVDANFAWVGITSTPPLAPAGRRVAIVLTDGGAGDAAAAKPLFDAIDRLELYCVAVDNAVAPASLVLVDNTPEDNIPLPRGGNATDLLWALRYPVASWIDMNPVHMLRDALSAEEDNTYANLDVIGDSFEVAADTLFDEGFGLSFYWRNNSELDKFRRKVEEHIDAALFFSRKTGKWEIKLIRDDYDVETMPMLDVLTWKTDVAREMAAELPNKLTLTYRKMTDGKKKSITVSDPASIAATGTVRPTKLDFEGVYDPSLAARVASRELRNRSQPKWGGTIIVGHVPADFDLGSEFKIQNKAYGMVEPIICRVAEITYGVETKRTITIKFIEDKFSLGNEVDIDFVQAVPPVREALNVVDYYLQEAPYYLVVQEFGQADTDTELTNDSLLGRLFMGAAKPSPFHTSVTYAYNEGTGWEEGVDSAFTPKQYLTADLTTDPTATTVTIGAITGLDDVTPGSLALIGSEVVRIDSLSTSLGVHTLVIGRGCLDTIPQAHTSGDVILFYDQYGVFSPITYVSTESLDVRMLTETTTDNLELADADTHNLVFAHRAARPYRCGDVQLNGSRDPLPILPATLTLTWKHRDRLQQTTATPEDYLANDIGPEAGVTYRVSIYCVDDAGTVLSTISAANVGAVNTYTVPDDLLAGRHVDTTYYAFSVIAERDGLDNWENVVVYCSAFTGPGDLTLEEI